MIHAKEDSGNKKIILVDENDKQIGVATKKETHEQGLMHRCFSILVFNNKNELLMQQRAKEKYHSGGLWANTCCSHPEPGEEILEAAKKRLKEEMGFNCELQEDFVFHYRTEFDNGLIEDEVDHVLIGSYNGEVIPNPGEVDDFKWMKVEDIKQDMQEYPQEYASWFKLIIQKLTG